MVETCVCRWPNLRNPTLSTAIQASVIPESVLSRKKKTIHLRVGIPLLHHCGIGFLGDSGWSRSTKEASQPPVRAKVGARVGAG